jgi:hypothetical protein
MESAGKVLLDAARAHVERATTSSAREGVADYSDPQALLHLARAHGLLPMLLSQAGDLIEEPALSAGKRMLQRLEFKQLESLRLLRGLQSGFAEQAVEAVLFKGPSLSAHLYGNPMVRQSVDLDFLVPPDHLEASAEVLFTNGFVLASGQIRDIERSKTSTNELTFVRDGLVVELQWSIVPRYFSVPLDIQPFWGRLEEIAVGDLTVPTFADEDLLLLLLLHGGKHLWERLGWICDIAVFLQADRGVDFERLMVRAQAARCLRMILIGLRLASQLSGTPPKPSCVRWMVEDEGVERVARTLWARTLTRDPDVEDPPFRWLDIAQREHVRDRLTYSWLLATTPTMQDMAVTDPRRRVPFGYLPGRVARLTKKYGRRLVDRQFATSSSSLL